jgi:hypothetical protein
MASTYVNDLRLNEMATGDASGSWGTVTNTNLELIGEAFSYGTETIGDADSTLTIADGASDPVRSFFLKITSSVDLTTTRIVTLAPNTVSKVWMIENATTGSQVITIKQGSGATINVPNGQVKMISTDGAGSGGAVLDLLVDVDLTGTTTLVNLDVSGAVDIAGDLTLSAGGDGALRFTAASSVKVLDNNAAALVFEEADNAYMTFVTTDGSEAVKFDKALDINAATQIDATVTVGVDDTGYDVKFFGATAGAYMLWDESADDLILGGAAGLSVNSTALVTGVLTTTAATVFNGGFAANAASTITVADNSAALTLVSTDTDAGLGPQLDLYRNPGQAGTDGDLIGQINFYGLNDASEKTHYVYFNAKMNDVANGSEDVRWAINGIVNGVDSAFIEYTQGTTATGANPELNFNGTARDMNFRVESSGNANMLFVDGGDDRVGIGMVPDTTTLTVSGQVGTTNGTAGAPTHTFYGDADTGMYRSSANALAFSTGGTAALTIDSSGNLIIANTGGTLYTTTAGTNNFRAGVNAGNSIASGGNYNVLVGDEAGTAITTGDHNVAIGFNALDAEDGGTASVAIGSYALSSQNADGNNYNTAVGYVAGSDITSGVQNTLIGAAAGDALTDADNNVALGYASLSAETNNNGNTAIGAEALMSQNVGGGGDARNTAVGFAAGTSVTSGIKNTLIGGRSGDALSDADSNVAIGESALSSDTLGSGSVAIGDSALYSQNFTSAATSFNTAVGYAAGNSTTTGQSNVFVGYYSGQYNSTGYANTFIGSAAGTGVTGARITGNSNTAVGQSAGEDLQGGASDNTFLGANAGGQVTTGSHNILIGHDAGTHDTPITTGANNIIIGNFSDIASATGDDAIVMGYNVTGVGADNFTFGRGENDSNIAFGATSITAPSDQRYKEEISDSTAGLAFIKDLRPVTFKWKKEKDLPTSHRAYVEGSETRVMNDYTNHGFIAQEVKTAIDSHPELKDGFDMWSEQGADGRQRLGPSSLIPMLVKALQELSAKNDALEARMPTLEG